MIKRKKMKTLNLLRRLAKLFAVWIFPPLYKSYMWIVYRTSKKTETEFSKLLEMTTRGENVLGAMWRQDAFISPFCHKGHNSHVMVSHSGLENIATEFLSECDVTAMREVRANGGEEALDKIISYINTRGGTLCGITVDGSRGPARKVHCGIMLVAKATGAPIYPVRSWAKRRLPAPTWDRNMIPLPFNHIVFVLGEPIHVPTNAGSAMLEILRSELERRLNRLVEYPAEFFQNEAMKVQAGISET